MLETLTDQLAAAQPLAPEQVRQAVNCLMDESGPAPAKADFLVALARKGETPAEIAAFAAALRERSVPAPIDPGWRESREILDIVGTGGDRHGTFNISTTSAIVCAAAGVAVAKHGNRALSSRAGAADVLTALGVNVDAPLEILPQLLAACGCAFLFAPRHHAALRHAAEARRELGIRTIFNLAGPMANPARVTRQLTGVFDPVWARPMAEALRDLGTEKAWLVHGLIEGSGGLDELTLAGDNQVVELNQGAIRMFSLSPSDAGLPPAPIEAIKGGDADFNARALRALLSGAPSAYRDTVLFNAAAGLIVAGHTESLQEAVALAADSIDKGAAQAVLDHLRLATNPPNPN